MYQWIIECREYTEDDWEKLLSFLAELGSEALRFLLGDRKVNDYSKEEYHKLLGLVDGEIIAFGYLWENKDYPDIPSLGIAIKESWRGKKVGQYFTKEIIKLAKKLKAKAIYISVDKDNPVATHIYRKMGWKIIGQRPDNKKFVMRKDL